MLGSWRFSLEIRLRRIEGLKFEGVSLGGIGTSLQASQNPCAGSFWSPLMNPEP